MMKLKMLQQEENTRRGSIKIIYKGPKDFKILCPYFVKSGYKKKRELTSMSEILWANG